jgi:hypothetical protein
VAAARPQQPASNRLCPGYNIVGVIHGIGKWIFVVFYIQKFAAGDSLLCCHRMSSYWLLPRWLVIFSFVSKMLHLPSLLHVEAGNPIWSSIYGYLSGD